MQERVPHGREFRRRVTSGRVAGPAATKRAQYAKLMQVDIRHEFYGDGETWGPCPDFRPFPTPPTQELMHSLGLLFVAEETGFSVVYDRRNTEGLCSYLRGHGVPPGGGETAQHWTRLSFVLSLDDPTFVNFTDIPVDTNPRQENFYFTNQQAHRSGAAVVLNAGDYVNGAALLPVEGPEVKVAVPQDVEWVVAYDIAGFPVLKQPRCILVPGSPPSEVCRPFVYLDFRTLPEDKYVIGFESAEGTLSLRSRPILYTMAQGNPLCFIDLLFSRPTEFADGIYPVDLDAADPADAIEPKHYTLRFKARSTYWRYYIVPEPQREQLEDLAIVTLDWPQVPFSGPDRVRLINGAHAYCFASEEPLLLQQHSSYRFRLNGCVAGEPLTGDPLIARMPVAGSAQVLPEGGEENSEDIYSDIYVYV